MAKKLLLLIVFTIPLIFISANATQVYDMFDIYLQPRTMQDDGSIAIGIRIRNIESVASDGVDGISAVAFNLNIDETAFSIPDNPISIDESTLITTGTDILSHVYGNTINFMFIDMSLGHRLIARDGYLAFINIRARNPRNFFHSPYVYPLTFDRNSVQVTTIDRTMNYVAEVSNIHVWDVNVGGQVFETLLPPLRVPIANAIYVYGDMIPVRYVADLSGAGVQWRAVDRAVVLATVNNRIVELFENSNIMIIDGEEIYMAGYAVIYDNRLFIPRNAAAKIFPALQ